MDGLLSLAKGNYGHIPRKLRPFIMLFVWQMFRLLLMQYAVHASAYSQPERLHEISGDLRGVVKRMDAHILLLIVWKQQKRKLFDDRNSCPGDCAA